MEWKPTFSFGNGKPAFQVYEVYDSTAREVRALKCVELSVDAEVREAYLNEIELLSSLQQCPYVIKMHD